jgi:tRNA pseudouridine13 synthase
MAASELPFLTAALPGIGGSLKHSPEDFEVEEIPAYEPSGSGEHLFLWVEKRDVSAEQLTRHLARTLGIAAGEIGVAGLKDRRAVTRQYVSLPARVEAKIGRVETDAIRVLRSMHHGNKLRTGHLKGNRFSILVRQVASDAAAHAAAIAGQIRQLGFPNYFGEQRFGREGETLRLGFDLLRGLKSPRDLGGNARLLLRLALSAVQSHLFNEALADRLTDASLHRVLAGDVMEVVVTGGKFLAEDAAAEQERFARRQIVTTGPLFGPKMKQPQGEPAEREARILERHGLMGEHFLRYRKLTSGARRPYLIWPEDLEIESESEGLRFRFTLPSGVYATTLLREFQKLARLAGDRDR